jgi:hypothetical protein
MSFPLFTTIPPKSDFRPLIENWKQSGFKVTSINNPDEAEILRAAGVNVLEVESQDKKLKITQIMRAIASAGEPLAGFINADCRFIRPIDAEALKAITKNSLILAERIDVNDAGEATRTLSMGFDAFFFDATYLKAIPDDAEYRIGTPWWDYWYPLIMRRAGAALKKFSCPILLHTAHDLNWDKDAYLKGARELQAAFPDMRILENNRPDEFSCFNELSSSAPVSPPGFDEVTAPLLSSIPSLIKDIRNQADLQLRNSDLEQHAARLLEYVGFLQNENAVLAQNNAALQNEKAALLNSNFYLISYPLRLAFTITRRAISRFL